MPQMTFGAMKRRLQLLVGQQIDVARAGEFIKARMTDLGDTYTWSRLQQRSLLATVAPKSTGTVALTTSSTITGTGTSLTTTDVGSTLRVANDVGYYEVVGVTGQVMTISPAYAGASFTGSTYLLFRRIYPLHPEARRILSPAFYRRLQERSLPWLDSRDPDRRWSGTPEYFTYRGQTDEGVLRVELWPWPSTVVGIPYTYQQSLPEPLNDGSDDSLVIPLPAQGLLRLAAADALYARAAEVGEEKPQLAQVLVGLAQTHTAIGEARLLEERYADEQIASAPSQVGEAVAGVGVSEDVLLNHDLFNPWG